MTSKNNVPHPERIEAIEADINELKSTINTLRSQLGIVYGAVIATQRESADLYVRHHAWLVQSALLALTSNQAEQQQAFTCIQHARETAVAAVTEIRHSENPRQLAETWYAENREFLRTQGFPNLLP